MTRAATARVSDQPASPAKSGKGYFQRSESPLASLIFLLPFLVVYEVGTRYNTGGVLAFAWMQRFFRLFGATGPHLPALAVVGILLSWHIARRDTWKVEPMHLLGMLLESTLLAIPLVLLCMVAATYLKMAAQWGMLSNAILCSVGAGIYEELVFRLIAFSVLSFLLIDLMALPKTLAMILTVVIASLAFSLYHYLGGESFSTRTFVFRTAAGIYFGAVFACRGFGLSAGAHTSYDVIVTILRTLG